MSGILSGLRVVEVSAFVAAPLGGLVLAELGAEVIRVDPLGGGLDRRRWPVTADGVSLYWAGLNQGKRSVAIDTTSSLGRDLVVRLVTAPGEDAGILITNVSPRWLDYDELRAQRPDLIMVTLGGSPDGKAAVDYTVNASVGLPLITGEGPEPVNHVLPAWDLIAGHQVATAVLAAERHRSRTGEGQRVSLTLADVALATMGHLGFIAQVQVNDEDRAPDGNYIYGTFGKDFVTADGSRVMVAALTPRQWSALAEATDSAGEMARLATSGGWDFTQEGDRYRARAEISAVLRPWFAAHSLPEVARTLDRHQVCWGPYQTVRELVEGDPRASVANPMFERVHQPGVGSYLAAATPLSFGASNRLPPQPAPALGQDTDQVLRDVAGVGDHHLRELRRTGVI